MNLAEMVEETMAYLRAYTRDQEMSTYLTRDVRFDEYEIPVEDAQVITRGRIEIGDELIWADKGDRSNNTIVVPPYGRGMDGSNKSDHPAGTRVIIQPLYPRFFVKKTLNQQIKAVGSKLFGVETITLPARTATFTYMLPSYVRDVLAVKVSDRRSLPYNDGADWLRSFTFDKHAPAGLASTGKALYLPDCVVGPTDEITVVVSRDPVQLMFDTEPFASSFLPESAWDVVVLLAASKLVASSVMQNVQSRSVEANTLDSKVLPRTGQDQSKWLLQMGMSRLDEERLRLLDTYVNRSHYSRRAR
jgi:hypothetical protein